MCASLNSAYWRNFIYGSAIFNLSVLCISLYFSRYLRTINTFKDLCYCYYLIKFFGFSDTRVMEVSASVNSLNLPKKCKKLLYQPDPPRFFSNMQRHQSNTILHLSSLTHLDAKYLSGACRLISHTRLTKERFSPRTNYVLIHYMKVINCYNARPRFVSSSAKFGYRRKTVVSDRGRSKSSEIRERGNEYLSQSTLASCYMST